MGKHRIASVVVTVGGIVLAPALVWAQQPPEAPRYGYGPHMMDWAGGWYGMIFGPLFMILVLAVVIALAVLHHVARLQRRHELGLDIGVEDLAVHRLIDHPRRDEAIATQAGDEGLRRPVPERCPGLQAGAAARAAAQTGHLGRPCRGGLFG